ncbi:cytochrome P450 4C1-like [Trichoplusia ni]|uniref:Cytochrome P450 4C1-like n=1 Tax=Trichoplusia ni TaxID=7111 RepID=A0A7E5VMQ3_TRINI|nr:cytochrome P450 4C1-like [Trichoplusia ni]
MSGLWNFKSLSEGRKDRNYYKQACLPTDPVFAEHLLKTCLEKDDSLRIFKIILQKGSIFAPGKSNMKQTIYFLFYINIPKLYLNYVSLYLFAVPIRCPRRKVLAPTFSPKNLKAFANVFSQESGILAERLKAVVGRGAFSAWQYMTTYTMDSVCRESFKLFNFLEINFPIIIESKRDALQKEHLDPNEDESLLKPKGDLKTFLELLIEGSSSNNGYSNVELREETLVLVLAGTDTSAVGAAFTLLMLAQHPNVQNKVYKEARWDCHVYLYKLKKRLTTHTRLQGVFEDSYRAVTAEDLPRLKYLDAVIRETLRLYPPVPFIVRKVTNDVTLRKYGHLLYRIPTSLKPVRLEAKLFYIISGSLIASSVTLVEGCGIFISIWGIHRNTRYWGNDAEQFRPKRFLEPLPHPAAFMPFSYGPRACLGYQYAMMSMKTALATIVRRYRIIPSDEKYTSKEVRVSFDVMMKDVDNFRIQLAMR